MICGRTKRKEKLAFIASCVYITAMLVGAVFALYPVVLPASTDPDFSLTISQQPPPATTASRSA